MTPEDQERRLWVQFCDAASEFVLAVGTIRFEDAAKEYHYRMKVWLEHAKALKQERKL